MGRVIGMRIPPKLGVEGIESVAALAASIGLGVVDVPSSFDAETKTVLGSYGLQVGTVDGVGAVGRTDLLSADEGKRAVAVESIKKQLSDLASLDARTLFLCLVPMDLAQSRERSFGIWSETFPDVAAHAERVGVYLALEGWPGPAPAHPTIGCTPEMLRAMFRAVPSKHFGVNYDPSHLVRLGIDYIRFLEEFGERVRYCHGKDVELLSEEQYAFGHLPATFGARYGFSDGSWRYTIPGQGEVDWAKVAVRLERIGYEGPISIELEDQRYWGTAEAEKKGIVEAKAHLARYFE